MSRLLSLSLALSFLGLAAPTTARAGECSIECYANGGIYLGGCSISAKNAVKCKCNPYPVCKRIWALEINTLDDFTTSSQEQLDEIDAQLELATDLNHEALAEVLERLREALLAGDREAFAAAAADHDRVIQELPAEHAGPARAGARR